MLRNLRTSSSAALISLVWLVATTAQAQEKEAQRFLQHRHDAVIHVLEQPAGGPTATKKRDAKLDQMLGNLLDYEELSRRALGAHWSEHSQQERDRFVDLLKQLVQRSYKQNLQRTLGYRVQYVGGRNGDDGVVVKTVARSRKNPRAPEVSIDYKMHRVGGQWRVYDVITDGVSMIRNYRNQFNRIIDKEGWSGLLKRMQKKLESTDDLAD